MKKFFMILATAGALLSCKKENDKETILKGAEVQMYNGKAWSWMKVNKDGTPGQLGITLTQAALNSVPTDDHSHDGHNMENSFVLPMHAATANKTAFQFINVDWNPAGHPPQNVYTLPHFDFHFYMVPEAEVMAAVDPVKLAAQPAPAYLPQNYMGGNPVPQMGLHWVDITSPELNPTNPQTFTQTFIYGSYDSKVTFYEPMITLAFLKNTSNFERAIPQPAKVSKTGFYPSKMKVVKEGNETVVILQDFYFRQAS